MLTLVVKLGEDIAITSFYLVLWLKIERVSWWRLKNVHIRLVVVLVVVVAVDKVDVGILGDGSGVSLHYDCIALEALQKS